MIYRVPRLKRPGEKKNTMSNLNQTILRDDLHDLREQIALKIHKEMQRKKITGLSLGLVDGNEVAWAEGFGYADKEHGISASLETVYKICSISKLFTATAVMQLVEQGKIDLDQTIQAYLPEFAIQSRYPESKPITVRSLMTHHSGLPVDNRHSIYAGGADQPPEPFQGVLEYLKTTYTAYPVDYIFSYSNLAIDVLGMIIERVSGETYETYVKQHILEPLRMFASSVQLIPDTSKRLSKGYHHGLGVWEPMIRDIPAGGIHSTVLDMARFMSMILGQGSLDGSTLLRSETLAHMLTPQNVGNPFDFNLRIGLNWVLSRPALEYAGKVAWHDGSSQYFNTILILLPDHKLGVVVLCNSDSAAQTVSKIAEEILQASLNVLRKIKVPIRPALPAIIQKSEYRESLEEYAGIYPTLGLGLVKLTVARGENMLSLKGLPLQLIPQEDSWYRLRLRLLGLIPIPLAQLEKLRVSFHTIDGKKVFAVEQDGIQIAMSICYSPHTIHPAWHDAVGKYQNLDAKDPTLQTLELKQKQDLLYVEGNVYKMGKTTFYLNPLSDSQALTLGLGRSGNETVFLRKRDGVPHLEIYGLVFKRSGNRN
jgi:CubicO group peptidase (beta-lactamase class C family)